MRKIKERWRKEMLELLMKIIKDELYPTPGRMRFIAELLLTLREIMLMDKLEDRYSKEALRLVKYWVEGGDFDLIKELKDFAEFLKRLKEKK
jgi:hypothetical protein